MGFIHCLVQISDFLQYLEMAHHSFFLSPKIGHLLCLFALHLSLSCSAAYHDNIPFRSPVHSVCWIDVASRRHGWKLRGEGERRNQGPLLPVSTHCGLLGQGHSHSCHGPSSHCMALLSCSSNFCCSSLQLLG